MKNFTCNLLNKRQTPTDSFLPLSLFSRFEWLFIIFKSELFVYSYSARKLDQGEHWESEGTELIALALHLLTVNWFRQTATTFRTLLDNSGVRGPQGAANPTCCSRQGLFLVNSSCSGQVLITSRNRHYTSSLSSLFPCLVVLMGKEFCLVSSWKFISFNLIENKIVCCLLSCYRATHLVS